MAGYERGQKRFNFRGLDLNNPVDHVIEDGYPFCKNVRSYVAGTVQSRSGLTALYPIAAGQTPARSFRRLNGVNGGQWVRVSKSGTVIAVERSGAPGSASNLVTGLSADPATLLPYRPDQSVDSWMIFADNARMGKIRENGTDVHQLGLDAPCAGNAFGMSLPSPAIDAPKHTEIDYVEYANTAAVQAQWTQGGVCAAPFSAPTRINTTTNFVLFDSGTSGWACIRLNKDTAGGLASLTIGSIVKIGSEPAIYVQEIHRGDFNHSYPITSIVYDSNSLTGLCSIQLTTPTTDIEPNSMLQADLSGIGGPFECIRVLSVTVGKDGRTSLRCSTVNTLTTSTQLFALASFRAYLGPGHTTGSNISVGGTGAENVTSQAMATITTGAGTGTLVRTVSLDLSQIASGLPLRDADLMCLSVKASVLASLTTVRVDIDIDADAANQDFLHNALFYEIRQSDIQIAITGAESLLDNQTTIQRNALIDQGAGRFRLSGASQDAASIDEGVPIKGPGIRIPQTPGADPTSPTDSTSSTQTGSGDNQWSTIQWRIADMTRTGTDKSRSLRNVDKIQITIVCSDSVEVDIDSWFVRGGYSLNTRGALLPYSYGVVARSSLTGVASAMSPPSRTVVFPERQRVLVALSQYTAAAEVDKLDVYRYGGNTIGWHYIGTTPNTSNPIFVDDYADDVVGQNDPPPDSLRPWPQIIAPVSGTAVNVAGTSVTGNGFNPLWMPGTEIVIGGIPHTIYRVISGGSSGVLELYDAADRNAGLGWEIAEPVLLGQPFAVLAEFAAPSGAMFYLGCGDPINPGRLYYSIGNNADGARLISPDGSAGYVDLTSGSEPLQAIVTYNGQPVVFSTKRAFALRQVGTGFIPSELPVGRGAFGRWAVAVADAIYFLAEDGIYATTGGDAKNLTAERLGPLFPQQKEGLIGVSVNGVPAPAMTAANAAEMRLSVCGGGRWLFFDYVDGGGARNTLLLDLSTGIWHYDAYTPGLVFHTDEESPGQLHDIKMVAGGADATTAKLYSVGGSDDAGAGIACQLRTASLDVGDPRMRKRFGDTSVEINAGGATVTATPGFDNHTTTLTPTNLPSTAARVQTVIDFNSGEGQRAKNISLDLAWTANSSAQPILYFWEPSWLDRPVGTIKRATDYDNFGQPICKWVQGIYLEADTFGVARSAILRTDEGVQVLTISGISHSGKSTKYYPLETPVYAFELSLIGTDANEWDLYGFEPDYEPAPPLSSGPGFWSNLGYEGAKFIQAVVIDGDTGNASVDVRVEIDEGALQTTITTGANQGPVQMNGRAEKVYSFDVPFVAHLVRLNPSAPMRMGTPWKLNWIFEPEPELATHYETQQTTHDLTGFQLLLDGYVTVVSSDVVSLSVYVDGALSPTAAAIFVNESPNTIGQRKKLYFRFPTVKGKSFRYVLASASGFRLYQRDCEVRVKSWGDGAFRSFNPFGAEHRLSGARA